jgi:hypothetical protein
VLSLESTRLIGGEGQHLDGLVFGLLDPSDEKLVRLEAVFVCTEAGGKQLVLKPVPKT